jgi:GNAT superfamily N-acetyltransferase
MISELTVETLPMIREIGEAFATEANYPGGFNLDAFCKQWNPILAFGLGKIFCVVEDNRIVGALGAAFIPDCFSGAPTAVEQFWLVLESHRKTKLGLELFSAFEQEAKARKVSKIVMVHLAFLAPQYLEKFYLSQGYSLAEKTFWKELKEGGSY